MDHLANRFEFLRASQNPDGGWGYFPGRHSWLEPTVYAALALAGDRASSERVQRAWALVRSWQNADGGWRPTAAVSTSTWGTALAITFADTLGERGAILDRGTRWLLESTGAESSMLNRVLRFAGVSAFERDVKFTGWPWIAGTSAWVEPTAHSLTALKKLFHRKPDSVLAERIENGERMLLSVRCQDGGWNYGSPRALGVELPSYAETTALALIGLQRRAPADAVKFAAGLERGNPPPLARAWLRIALGKPTELGEELANDVLLCGLQALNGDLLRPGALI